MRRSGLAARARPGAGSHAERCAGSPQPQQQRPLHFPPAAASVHMPATCSGPTRHASADSRSVPPRQGGQAQAGAGWGCAASYWLWKRSYRPAHTTSSGRSCQYSSSDTRVPLRVMRQLATQPAASSCTSQEPRSARSRGQLASAQSSVATSPQLLARFNSLRAANGVCSAGCWPSKHLPFGCRGSAHLGMGAMRRGCRKPPA